MKKILAICLMIALVASLSISVFAAPNGFVSSPSGGKRPPVLDRFDPVDEDCTANVIITPFSDKNNLKNDERENMEDAYEDIVNAGDLSNLNKDLADTAKDKNIDGKHLAVSDLFHLGSEGCNDHEDHSKFEIELDMDALDNFVGLIYRDSDGKWQWVPDAKVDGTKLQFTGMGYHPYAVVVDSRGAKTGDTATVLICTAVMAVSAIALVVILVKGKKRHA